MSKKIPVRKLRGNALDWAVAVVEAKRVSQSGLNVQIINGVWQGRDGYRFSTDWALAGPIIERERIQIAPLPDRGWRGHWRNFAADSKADYRECWMDCFDPGVTALHASMRCYVQSVLGDSVEVPDEILELPDSYQDPDDEINEMLMRH